MARRKKGIKLDGWIIIDKPLGLTSSQVVGKARYLTKAQKVGHAGTLDPLASGVLPLGFGEATKTMPFIVDATKSYEFSMCWGTSTTTDDKEGEVLETSDIFPDVAEIKQVLDTFIGDIDQTPPAYSAIKVDGKRAYALARAGEDVQLKSRKVTLYSLKILCHDPDSQTTTLSVTCGKGTYIRSLARDLAEKCGSKAHVSMLRRTRVGPFSLKHAISLEKLEELSHSAPAQDYMLSMMTALDDISVLAISESEAMDIGFGRSIKIVSSQGSDAVQGTVVLVHECHPDQPVALATVEGNDVQPLRVFNI